MNNNISEALTSALLSLRLISDRLKSLVTNSSTKTDVSNAKGDIITAIGNIPEPDLSSLATEANATSNKNAVIAAIPTDYAKLGSDSTATNTAILDAVNTLPTEDYMKNMYSARFEQNNDGDDTYTVVLPIVAGVEESESGHSVIVTM